VIGYRSRCGDDVDLGRQSAWSRRSRPVDVRLAEQDQQIRDTGSWAGTSVWSQYWSGVGRCKDRGGGDPPTNGVGLRGSENRLTCQACSGRYGRIGIDFTAGKLVLGS